MALPLLDAMIPALTATAATPVQASSFVELDTSTFPWVATRTEWLPTGRTLDQIAVEPFPTRRDQGSGERNQRYGSQNAYPGSHATSNSAFLSAARAKLTESTDYYLGTTVDQIAAKQIGQVNTTPFARTVDGFVGNSRAM